MHFHAFGNFTYSRILVHVVKGNAMYFSLSGLWNWYLKLLFQKIQFGSFTRIKSTGTVIEVDMIFIKLLWWNCCMQVVVAISRIEFFLYLIVPLRNGLHSLLVANYRREVNWAHKKGVFCSQRVLHFNIANWCMDRHTERRWRETVELRLSMGVPPVRFQIFPPKVTVCVFQIPF